MAPRKTDARQRVVEAAAGMLAQHGLNATSIREMAKKAGAPVGSTYHHFPGGKQQVIMEAVNLANAHVSRQLSRYEGVDVAAELTDFLLLWRNILVKSDFHVGCPVMAVAVEEPLDELMEEAVACAAQAFRTWQTKLSALLLGAVDSAEDANGMATLIIAGIEGAIGICRVERSIAPFDQVSRHLLTYLASHKGPQE